MTPGRVKVMSHQQIRFDNVYFAYDSLGQPIFEDLSLSFDRGFTGVVGPNGAGKTTLLHLVSGRLVPQAGRVHRPECITLCDQRTDSAPQALPQLMDATDALACRIRGRLKLQLDWTDRWETLSHGERKRAQIAVALWQEPDVLAIDEPSNHLDAEGRRLVQEALEMFHGVGIIVSHDRALVDTLCSHILWLSPSDVRLYPGNYSKARALRETEHQQQCHARAQVKLQMSKVRRQKTTHSRDVAKSRKRNSKRGLARGDADARAKRDLARLTGKDGQPGRKLKRLASQEARLASELTQTHVRKQSSYAISLEGERYRGDRLIHLTATDLPLGNSRHVYQPECTIGPTDRIGLIGPNGCGKSTLLNHLIEQSQLPPHRVIYLPQEISEEEAQQTMQSIRHLSPAPLGDLMTFVGCLGSDPERLLQTELPSPGEMRKLMLALGMLQRPYIVIMDEPTNHLDIPSIEALERTLKACDCALILVSHDRHFLDTLTNTTWEIVEKGERHSELTVQ